MFKVIVAGGRYFTPMILSTVVLDFCIIAFASITTRFLV